jgi:SWI/SNF-related matrix-associated actin-dependent regulator of chromatin subfamily A3
MFLILYSITYERFDGQMSAQRRRDTIERFCVPIKDDDVPLAPSQDHSTDVVSSTGRPVRRARSNCKVSSDVIDVDASDDGSDFENSGGEGDDSFAEDDDVIDATPKKKGKGKGKAKAPATTRIASRMAHGVNSKARTLL